jgi:AAA domain
LKHAGRDVDSQSSQRLNEFSVKRFPQFRWRSLNETWPTLPARVTVQSKLRHRENFAARIRQRPVHFSLVVVEYPQIENLLRHRGGGVVCIFMADRDEHNQAAGDFADGCSIDNHASARRSLNHSSHRFAPTTEPSDSLASIAAASVHLRRRSILFAPRIENNLGVRRLDSHHGRNCVRNKVTRDPGTILKLALIGTHGVGKTTLAYELCSLLKKSHHNVELVTEVARQSPFPVNDATTIEGQLWILHAQIAAELDAARRAPHVITDRSVLDNYCYLVNKFGRQPQLESWLAWWMNTYNVLVGVPPVATEIPSDGFRSQDRAFQQRIHETLIELLSSPPFDQLRSPVLWLKAEERGQWADRIITGVTPLLSDKAAISPAERSAR